MTPVLLVVEGEVPIREVLRPLLEDEGYRVVGVGDGRAALAALAADRYDLVLSDTMALNLHELLDTVERALNGGRSA